MRMDVRCVAAPSRVYVRPPNVVTAPAPVIVPGPVNDARRIRVDAAPNRRHAGWIGPRTGRAARSIETHHNAGPQLPTSADVVASPPPTAVPSIADRRPRGCPVIPATATTWTFAVRPARSTPHRGAGRRIGTTLPVVASGDRAAMRTRRPPTRPQARSRPRLRARLPTRQHRNGRSPPRARLNPKRRLPRRRSSHRTSRTPSPPTTRPRRPAAPRISHPRPRSQSPARPQPPPHRHRRASRARCARRCASATMSRACWWHC